MRFRDYGGRVGYLPPGPLNAITDVPGVRVGQVTYTTEAPSVLRTGVTVIWPHDGNPDMDRVYAGTDVLNGYGIMTGRATIDEWGLLGSPVVLTDTRSVGTGYEAVIQHLNRLDPGVGDIDVAMPVVAECDDGHLNDNRGPAIPVEVFEEALSHAVSGPVREGSVGAGTGMALFSYKGGIGTASRQVSLFRHTYTVGVLVNTNFGRRHQMLLAGHQVGRALTERHMPSIEKEGSCIGVVATDAPLLPHQLKRLAKRVGFGLVRTGSVGNDSSGELFLAFSTATRVPKQRDSTFSVESFVDGQVWSQDAPIDRLFDATVEAAEESVYNALCEAETVTGRDGHTLHRFPIEQFQHLFS